MVSQRAAELDVRRNGRKERDDPEENQARKQIPSATSLGLSWLSHPPESSLLLLPKCFVDLELLVEVSCALFPAG